MHSPTFSCSLSSSAVTPCSVSERLQHKTVRRARLWPGDSLVRGGGVEEYGLAAVLGMMLLQLAGQLGRAQEKVKRLSNREKEELLEG
eukprot:756488-Hanusia_phi.AAC.2